MRAEKKAIVDEIRGLLEEGGYTFLVDYRGLSVEQLAELRKRLREAESKLHVVKNDFFKFAAKDIGWEDTEAFLSGPTAVIIGVQDSDVTKSAKMLVQFKKETTFPVIKGGRLGDKTLSAEDVQEMSRIESREVLYGKLAGVLNAPMSGLVGVMQQKLQTLVYVLKAVEEKKANK